MMEYEVKTTPSSEGKFVQDITRVHDGVRELISRRVMDTSEAQVRAALIQLGWIPPKQETT
jgi:hypothetical protein